MNSVCFSDTLWLKVFEKNTHFYLALVSEYLRYPDKSCCFFKKKKLHMQKNATYIAIQVSSKTFPVASGKRNIIKHGLINY